MGFFNTLFGTGSNSEDVKQLLDKGAVVIDVRTVAEFRGGNVPNSRNIPLQEFNNRLDEIAKIESPVVLCCRSGARSGQAYSLLKQKRSDCINGGSWQQVNALLNN